VTCRQNKAFLGEDTAYKIMETVVALNSLLDVEHPWTVIVHDPSGRSDIKPSDGVITEEVEG
jgi:C4-type Zn-finger protein